MYEFPQEDLFFHGTLEPIKGALKASMDGLLWFAKSPAIAQSYIPRSGASVLFSYPNDREQERVQPSFNGSGWHAVVRMMGFEDPEDMVWDRFSLVSWRIPQGWPTYGEAVAWFNKELGYSLAPSGSVWVSASFSKERGDVLHPASWRSVGRLFVAKAPNLKFFPLSDIKQSDLSDPAHLEFEKFADIEEDQKWDGVCIDDFLQSENHGNVPHKSFGVFQRSLHKMSFLSIPAVNYDWDASVMPGREESTPEWEAALRQGNNVPISEFLADILPPMGGAGRHELHGEGPRSPAF